MTPTDTQAADHNAARAATALGRAITLTTAAVIALAPAALWPGTPAATAGLCVGAAITARVLYVAATSKETPS